MHLLLLVLLLVVGPVDHRLGDGASWKAGEELLAPGLRLEARLEVGKVRTQAGDVAAAVGILTDVVRALIRYRYPLLITLVLGRAILEGRGAFGIDDAGLFAEAGRRLASPQWANVFADEAIQAGPLQLALLGAIAALADAVGLGFRMLASILIQTGYLVAVVASVRMVARDRRLADPAPLELAAGLLAIGWGLTWTASYFGHPAQAFVPLLWLWAARSAREGAAITAGLLIGLSAGLETWGLLGAPLLLLAPTLRQVLAAGVASGAAVIALFAPFFLFGTVDTFDHRWTIEAGAPVALLLGEGAPFGWPLRLLQASVTTLLGAALARRVRKNVDALWLLPLALVLVRLLLDPLGSSIYYWLPVETLALIGGTVLIAATSSWRPRLLIGGLVYIAFLRTLLPFTAVVLLLLAAAAAALVDERILERVLRPAGTSRKAQRSEP